MSYHQVFESYSENQSKLEPEHECDWFEGEFIYNQCLENEILLSDDTKKKLHDSSLPQLFELFFSKEIKTHIIEATVMNGYPLIENDFDIFSVVHEKNSGVNFITVMDSKPVSMLSTAAGVTPLFEVQRFSFDEMKKVNILFPRAFKLYNLFMGVIDLHDLHCSNLMSFIRAKKWTWPMFLRFIQSSMTNATVIHNLVHEKKIGTKDMALELAKYYLARKPTTKLHKSVSMKLKKKCENFEKCATRTQKMCETCNVYSCSSCFSNLHK